VSRNPLTLRTVESAPMKTMVWPAAFPADPSPPAPVYWAMRMLLAVLNPPASEMTRKTSGNATESAPTASAE
jgi:hypothetical protein